MAMNQSAKHLAAGMIGNILEWYEFTIYGFLAATIAPLFFPTESRTAGLLAAFGVFAAGFLTRPLGALIFGPLGDRRGRKIVLIRSIIFMALPTLLLGLLPTYQQIGIIAPLALLVLRLIQGIAVGGETPGAMIFLVEHGNNRPGFFGSATFASSFTGTLLAAAVVAILETTLSSEQMMSWGWRLPYLIGIFIVAFGLYLRYAISETPAFKNSTTHLSNPLKTTLTMHWPTLLRGIAVICVGAVSIYDLFIFMPTYLEKWIQIPAATALWTSTASMVLMVILCLVFGWLSDKYGSRRLMIFGTTGLLVLAYPMLYLINTQNLVLISIALTLLTTCTAAYVGPSAAYLANLFTTQVRSSGVSLTYNIGLAIFGGTAPLVATAIITVNTNPNMLFLPIFLSALITLIAITWLHKPQDPNTMPAS